MSMKILSRKKQHLAVSLTFLETCDKYDGVSLLNRAITGDETGKTCELYMRHTKKQPME